MGEKRATIRSWWRDQSIATIIVVSFSILFAVVTTFSAVLLTISVRRTLIQSVYDSNKKLVNEAVANIDSLNNLITSISFYIAGDTQLKQMLKQFTEDPIEQIAHKNEVKKYLTHLWMNRPEIVGISIYLDAVKEVNTSAIGVSSLSFPKKHGWIDILNNNRGLIINTSSPITRGSSVFNTLSLVKILDESNQTLGLLSFEIAAKNVYDQCMERSLASSNSILFAINEEQVIVNHQDSDILYKQVLEVYPQIDLQIARDPSIVSIDGKRYILVVSKPSKFKWNVVELISLEDVFDFTPFLIIFALLTSLSIILSSFLIFLITKRLTRPIVDLSLAMISETPLEATLPSFPLESQNEVGTLYRSYQEMTGHITKLITQLQQSMENQKLLEINALRAQINPHFMYNCLDYINWKAQDANVPEISKMLTNLSRFMRISLSESNLTCLLSSEVEHVKTYLEIFQVRFQGSFTYTISVDPSLLQIQVPQFILQPLVENSIMHGFGKQFSGGHINVSITKENDWLCFHVIDNGKGMNKKDFDHVLASSTSSSRSGLKNINDRIRYVVSNEFFTGLQMMDSSVGLHIHFSIYLKRKGSFRVEK